MKVDVELWIPKKLTSERLIKEHSIALWAALTALTDTSTEESKPVYTQIFDIVKDKKGSSLITTKKLTPTYSSKSKIKYDEKWQEYFNQALSYLESEALSFGLVFDYDQPKDRISIAIVSKQPNALGHVPISIAIERKTKITIKDQLSKKPLRQLTALSPNRMEFIEPISSNDYKLLLRRVLHSYPKANGGQLTLWVKFLGRKIKKIDIWTIKENLKSKKYKNETRYETPFLTRTYGDTGDISVYLNKVGYSLTSSTWVILKSDFHSIKEMGEVIAKGHKLFVELTQDAKAYEYTYESNDSKAIRLHIAKQSNKKTKLPKSIVFTKK